MDNNNGRRIKVFGYIRRSTEDTREGRVNKQVNSLNYQRKAIAETAQRNNLEIVKIFEDKKTGYKAFVRDGFSNMLQDFQEETNTGEDRVRGIVCSEHSRLARNFADGGLVLWYLQCGLIDCIYTYDKIFTNSADDQMMLAISFAMDKHSSDETGFRMRKANDIIASGGQPPNQRLPGYKYEGKKGEKKWKIDPVYGPMIKMLFQEYSSGSYNLQQINDYMFLHGFVNPKTKGKYSKNTILNLLKKIEYTGIFYHKDEKISGTYIPLITSELFYKVQDVLNGNAHIKSSKENGNEYAYSGGFIKCAVCGGNMSGTVRKGITYYRCLRRAEPCKSNIAMRTKYLRERDIDTEAIKILESIQISEKTFGKFSKYIWQQFDEEKDKCTSDLRIYAEQKRQAEEDLKGYAKSLEVLKKEVYSSKDNIHRVKEEGLLSLMEDASQRIKMLESSINSAKEIQEKIPNMMYETMDALRKVSSRFRNEATPSNKRTILRTLCANMKWDGKKLVWTWKEPYHLLMDGDKKVRMLLE